MSNQKKFIVFQKSDNTRPEETDFLDLIFGIIAILIGTTYTVKFILQDGDKSRWANYQYFATATGGLIIGSLNLSKAFGLRLIQQEGLFVAPN